MGINTFIKKIFGQKSREEKIREFVEQAPETRKMLRGALRMENKDLALVFETKDRKPFEITTEELRKVYPDGIPALDDDEPEPSSRIEKLIKDFSRQTSAPCIAFALAKRKTTIYDNKFGGIPYWPKDLDYPHDADDNPMPLLAQLNFEKLPPLEGFPKKGILQFYISGKRFGPADLPSPPDILSSTKNMRVVYHKEIVTRKTALGTPPPAKKFQKKDYPLKGEFALNAQIKICPMTPSDFRFEKTFVAFYNNKTGKKAKTLEEIEDTFKIEFYEEYGEVGGHRIGGYPMFVRGDPRDSEKYKNHTILLLQIDSDNSLGKDVVRWGDSGVGNFFITPAALENLDFSNILYSRDFL
ncbi:MAG: DUF1963 domain-containing protein [Puniceicoccales bacterium]|jgi:uncharacterized protein YwqG|nr:DUF1963 domain-containing protein [Puniceicoccales bacterium]